MRLAFIIKSEGQKAKLEKEREDLLENEDPGIVRAAKKKKRIREKMKRKKFFQPPEPASTTWG